MRHKIVVLVLLALLAAGCRSYGPLIDLTPLQRIGLIAFVPEGTPGPLDEMATQHLLESILRCQPGVEVLELGTMDDVLRRVGRDRLDREALRELERRDGVAAVFSGRLRVSDIKPAVNLLSLISHLSVRAYFNVDVSGSLVRTDSGATLWTNSLERQKEVAEVGLGPGGVLHFDLKAQEDAYRRMVRGLVRDLTQDFCPRGY